MNRDQKAAAIQEIAESIEQAEAVFAVDYRGITVTQAGELRARLRDADARFAVVKNTLTERAADRAGAEPLKELLEGPTALTFVRGDAAAAAKALSDYARTTDLLAFKGGLMNGSPLSADEIRAIARLPSREVLYGQLVGVVAHPISGLARTLNALVSGLAIALGEVRDRGLVGGEAPPAAENAPPAEAAEQSADEVPTEAGVEPTDADAAPDADTDEDPDAGPASEPSPAQPDQAEGEDTPEETS